MVSSSSAQKRILGPRAARTFYNVADALEPAGPAGATGAGDLDLLPALERSIRHRGPAAARRCWLLMACIEWLPVASLASRRSFSRLDRAQRQRWLARAERIGARRALADLRQEIRKALGAARSQLSEGA